MTDLEQAREFVKIWHLPVRVTNNLATALAAARAEGKESERVKNAKVYFMIDREARREAEEEMREKAAHAIETQVVSRKHGEWLWKVYFPRVIRALKLEER